METDSDCGGVSSDGDARPGRRRGDVADHRGTSLSHQQIAGQDGPVAGQDGPVAGQDGPVVGQDGPVVGQDGKEIEDRTRIRTSTVLARLGIGVFAITMVVFWTWAMFFADPEPINRIGDTAWAERAEQRCSTTMEELQGLANFSTLAPGNTDQIMERASIVGQATDALTSMLEDITATPPTDAKGQALIPQWTAEYRTYLNDRALYVDKLRQQGRNLAFEETRTEDGVPVSERLATFAADNRMPACSPPHDLR